MEYTKGEWKVASAEFTDKGVAYEVIMPKQEICVANANLIAAAPLMYEAIQMAISVLVNLKIINLGNLSPHQQRTLNTLKEAIAKVEGK